MPRPRPDRGPVERQATVRADLARELRERSLTLHELSAAVRVAERQLADHLEHVARSLRAAGERLRVEPARCLECGFVFRKRERLGTPSACPICRGQRVAPPRFSIVRA